MTDVVALLISITALILTVWQILRTEGLTPDHAWEWKFEKEDLAGVNLRTGINLQATVMVRPARDFGAYGVRPVAWGSATIMYQDVPQDSPHGQYRIKVVWRHQDQDAYVGLRYYVPSKIFHRKVIQVIRIRCEEESKSFGEFKYKERTGQRWRWRPLCWLFPEKHRGKYVDIVDSRRSRLPSFARPDFPPIEHHP